MTSPPERVLEQLAQLASQLGTVIMPAPADELLQVTTELIQRSFRAAACSIAILDEEADEVVFRAASGAGAERVVGMRMPAGLGIAGWALTSGQPIAVEEVSHDARFAREVAGQTGYVPTSILAVPVQGEKGPLAVIEVLDRQEDLTSDESDRLALFARHVALILDATASFSAVAQTVFQIAARTASDRELSDAIQQVATSIEPGPKSMLELAGLLRQLDEAGEREREFSVQVLRYVLDFVHRTRA